MRQSLSINMCKKARIRKTMSTITHNGSNRIRLLDGVKHDVGTKILTDKKKDRWRKMRFAEDICVDCFTHPS